MTLLASSLASALQSDISNVLTESMAISNWATAYAAYASTATGSGVAINTVTAVPVAKAAMVAAMSGLSRPSAAAAAITAGCVAFWASIAAQLATSFVGATAITPPPLAGLATAISATFLANTTSSLSQAVACTALATAIHTQTVIGGTVTIGTGSPGPIV